MTSDLTALLRPHINAMWADREQLVQRVARIVTSNVPSYATTPSSEVWIGMTRILERTVEGNPLEPASEDDRIAAVGTGVQGAGAGIAADDLVTAVLLGAREVEREVTTRAEAAGVGAVDLLAASRQFRAWAEQAAVWALQGLLGASAGEANQQVRHVRLLAALQSGDVAAARTIADDLGLDLSRRWHAVVVMGESGVAVEPAMTLRLAQPDAVWGEMPGLAADAELVGIVRERPRIPDRLVGGVAGPVTLDELSVALRDAARAARAGRRFGHSGTVTLSELGLLVPLHEDDALAARLRERWVDPLRREARHDLEATVRMWLACDGQVDAVARQLEVHSNTVRNRLARVTGLVGADWRSPQGRAELWAALQATA